MAAITRSGKTLRTEVGPLLTLSCFWILTILVANPRGNFPLNDDCSYAGAVRHLLDTGHLKLSDWTSMTLIAQVLWGYCFSFIAGFSFNVLRAATCTSGLIGIFSVYAIARSMSVSQLFSLFAALTLAVNPLYFGLSFTFMTDTPFAAVTIFTLFCFSMAMRGSLRFWIVVATLLSIVATLTRQLGIVLPLAFALTFLLGNKVRFKTLAIACAPVALTSTALALYLKWLETVGKPAMYRSLGYYLANLPHSPLAQIALQCLLKTIGIAIYIGLMTLPLTAPRFIDSLWSQNRKVYRAVFVCLIVGITTAWLWSRNAAPFPFFGNVLTRSGLGPETLKDMYVLHLPHLPMLPGKVAVAIVFVSLLSFVIWIFELPLLFAEIWNSRGQSLSSLERTPILLLVFTLLYAGIIQVTEVFDRYLLPLMAIVLLFTLKRHEHSRRYQKLITINVLAGFALCSVVLTHDYMAWNRARWEALTHLAGRGISPSQIDGGFEFNGSHFFRIDYPRQANKSWWWVEDDQYVISFDSIPGYRKIDSYPYTRWTSGKTDFVYVLQRDKL